jgi:hypothetical protein
MNSNDHQAILTTNNAGFPPAAPQAHPSSSGVEQDLQFYPTPKGLAVKMWALFSNRSFERVLEPSAGDGALLDARPWASDCYLNRTTSIDCCEIDMARHQSLRNKGAQVVGIDFMQFQAGTTYSHIIMNPPFRDGASHVLKAWEILWHGEIVALINAETLRNPFSAERRLLAQLVAAHGSVEFIEDAFLTPETQRKTPVCVALIHLTKEVDMKRDVYGDLIGDLREDTHTPEAENVQAMHHELALPEDFVRLAVRAFDAAVSAMRDAVHAEARARHYRCRLGQTMSQLVAGSNGIGNDPSSPSWVQETLSEQYRDLKDRAWASILRSTQVSDRLSSGAQSRLESEFENIKALEFTVSNIYGFLCGLVCNQGAMQMDMACDAFDLFTRYHNDNTVYFRGWKSNDKHRTCGMRLKSTRFVLPGHGRDCWSKSFGWGTERLFADLDKIFALLDGKATPAVSLLSVARDRYQDLRAGERVSSSYFDLRFYPGVGTLHFFPRSKTLVDRLNRMVGRHRGWLPVSDEDVSAGFWEQFDKAEKLDKEVRAEVRKGARDRWDDPLRRLHFRDGEDALRAHEMLDQALRAVHEANGISTEFQLQGGAKTPQGQLPLLAA